MTGYKKGDVDLDTIFMARVNTKRADVNYHIADSDISNRYETIGDGTKVADVGYEVGGVDISNYFRDISEALETVTVSGESITDFDTSSADAGFRFNSDGTVDKREGGVYTQIDSTTDWIIPNGSASSDYEIRVTNQTGTWTSAAAAEDVWVNLGTSRLWYVQRNTEGPATVNVTVEIRYDGGSVLDSASYNCNATVEP